MLRAPAVLGQPVSPRSGPLSAASTFELVGNTPLVEIRRVRDGVAPGVRLFGKLEGFNPGGSVKDRPALKMIEDGLERGALRPGKTIIDSTSGNTGIALAMVGAALGYPVELVMPGNVSVERKKVVVAFGAKAIYSDPLEGSDGAIRLCRKILAEAPERYFKPDQYNNAANPQAHYETTGPEIWRQTAGNITHFVAGIGTGGTIMGTARGLRRRGLVQVVAVEPAEALHGLEGLKHMPTSIVPGIYDPSVQDEKISVPTEAAYELAHDLARSEGLLVGNSSGAALYAAREVARRSSEGVFVMVFPDGGDRYLSSGLYRRKF